MCGAPTAARLESRPGRLCSSHSLLLLAFAVPAGEGLSDAGVKAVVGALLRAQSTGWEYRGLMSLEDKMVNNSWMRVGLKGLIGHPTSTDFDEWAKATGYGPSAARNFTASVAHGSQAWCRDSGRTMPTTVAPCYTC